MMAVAFGGLALIIGLLVFAWVRRGRRGFGADPDDPHPGEKQSLVRRRRDGRRLAARR